MKFETREEIDGAIEDYKRDVVRAMTVHAYNEHVDADMDATAQANQAKQFDTTKPPPPAHDPLQFAVIDAAAQNYIVEYRQRLVERGATLVSHHGIVEEIPWMADFAQETRMRVSEIVEEGIVAGLAPSGETAAKLRALFNGSQTKAAMVARTETTLIRGQAKSARWKERNYAIVRITDGRAPGTFPCNCEQYDGQYWTVAYYQTHMIEHPNCGRAASPVQSQDVPPGEFVWGLAGGTIPRVGV